MSSATKRRPWLCASIVAGLTSLAGLIGAVGVLGSGCGGASAPGPAPGPAQPAPAAPGPAPGPASDAPVTEAECDQLADHLVELSMAEPRPERAEAYTGEDAEAAKRELRASMRGACGQLSRRQLACALAARTAADLAKC